MDSVDVFEELKCPICFEIPEDKIFLCQNGHPICDNCSTHLQICPQCRISFENVKVRNRTLEILLDTFKFECVHKQLGCNEMVGRKDRKAHFINCPFSGNNIKLCKDIGFSCEHSTNLMDIQKSFEHFKTEHEFIVRDDLHFKIHLTNFETATTFKVKKKHVNSMWTPVIINHCSSTAAAAAKPNLAPSKILLLSMFHGKDRSASWMCVRLSSEKNGQKYHAQFEIKSVSKDMPALSWRIPTIEASQIIAILPKSPFRIPRDLLVEHYLQKDGDLIVAVKLVPLKGKRIDTVLHSEPSMLINLTYHKAVQPLAANDEVPETTVIFQGTICEDCGVSPITEIRFLVLQGSHLNLCKSCVRKPSRLRQWYAVIRCVDQNNDIVSKMWEETILAKCTFKSLSVSLLNFNLFQHEKFDSELVYSFAFQDKCSTVHCTEQPATKCLQCKSEERTSFCEECMLKQSCSRDHVFVIFTLQSN